MKKAGPIIIVLLSLATVSFTQNYVAYSDNIVYSGRNNYPIYILFDADEDHITGVPIKCKMGGCTIPSLNDTSWVFIGSDSSYFKVQKRDSTITFQFRKYNEAVEGQFYIPKQRLIRYETPIDPETFDTVIRIEEYYLPIRTGKWKYTKDDETEEKIYNFKYDSSSDRYYYYNYKKN